MKPAWQLAATQTFNLGWDQMILFEGDHGAASQLFYRDVALTDNRDQRDHAPMAGE
jgi:hypothetical protein